MITSAMAQTRTLSGTRLKCKTDGMEGTTSTGCRPVLACESRPRTPAELAAVMDGAGTDAEKHTAAGLIDWSKKIGTQLVCESANCCRTESSELKLPIPLVI